MHAMLGSCSQAMGDFTGAITTVVAAEMVLWLASFCCGYGLEGRNENKTEKKKKCAVPFSFSLSPPGQLRNCQKLDDAGRGKKEIRVSGRSVIQADVLSHSRADVVGTTLSIFSLHVGLFSARYLAHSSCSSDEEEAPCCRSGIGHCVAALCAMELGPVFPGVMFTRGQ